MLGGFGAHKRSPHCKQSSTGGARRPETLNSPAFVTALSASSKSFEYVPVNCIFGANFSNVSTISSTTMSVNELSVHKYLTIREIIVKRVFLYREKTFGTCRIENKIHMIVLNPNIKASKPTTSNCPFPLKTARASRSCFNLILFLKLTTVSSCCFASITPLSIVFP